MSHAEIAGGKVTPLSELPAKGHRLRDFDLTSPAGRHVRMSDYRGRSNLVLIFSDDRPEVTTLLLDAARHYAQIKQEQAEVLVVVQEPRTAQLNQELPYPVLMDESGQVHYQMGATDLQGHTASAVYVTDRFGEVFGLYRTRDGQPLPAVTNILSWLEFINSQCPECEPPEWPA